MFYRTIKIKKSIPMEYTIGICGKVKGYNYWCTGNCDFLCFVKYIDTIPQYKCNLYNKNLDGIQRCVECRKEFKGIRRKN